MRRGSDKRIRFEVKNNFFLFGKSGLERPPGLPASDTIPAETITTINVSTKECLDSAGAKVGTLKLDSYLCEIDGHASVSVKALNKKV